MSLLRLLVDYIDEEEEIVENKMPMSTLISIIVASAVILLLFIMVLCIISRYKKLSKMRTRTEDTFMYMETYMKNRHKMIPRFVTYVKRTGGIEDKFLDDVINARNIAVQVKARDQKVLAEGNLQSKLNILYNQVRTVDSIEHDEAFEDFMAEMRTVESQVARTRISYNEAVTEYNALMDKWLSRMVSVIFGFEYEETFEYEDTALPSEYHL